MVSSSFDYENLKRFPSRERVNGVRVHRVSTSRFGRRFIPGRLVDYASFFFHSRRLLKDLLKKDTILVTKTDPPLLSLLGRSCARRHGVVPVNWLQDLFPEVSECVVDRAVLRPVYGLLKRLRTGALREAACNVVISGGIGAGCWKNAASIAGGYAVCPIGRYWIRRQAARPVRSGARDS